MTLRVRELNDHERVDVQRIARSPTRGAALVRRARIVVHAMDGLKAEAIATRMGLCGNTVRHWLTRFNARGLDWTAADLLGRAAQRGHHRRPDPPVRTGPAVCVVDPGPLGFLSVRAGSVVICLDEMGPQK